MSLLNLTFMAPLALLGLLALAVPIYLHMRHQPRAEAYRFPAIDFLLKAQKKRKRRFRVEQWVLMVFRIGIIGLMAFLFAKPFLEEQRGTGDAAAGRPLVILLDDSASMLADPGGERFFDTALSRIDDLLVGRPGGSPVRLLPASAPARYADADTAAAVRELLPSLKPTTGRVTLDAAYAAALELPAAMGWEGATLHVLTDGSRSAWRNLPERRPEQLDVIYTSLRRDHPDFANVGITAVAQPPGDGNSVEVTVRNTGPAAVEVPVSLAGTGVKATGNTLRLEPGASMSHYFALPEGEPADMRLRIPSDGFDLDNEVLFVPRPNRLTRLLIVDGDTHPDAVNNESFFLKNALGFEESEKYGFTFRVVTPVGLTDAAAADADVVLVLNVDLPAKDVLLKALAAGKGVFVGMGERMDFEAWNAFLREVDLEMWEVKTFPEAQPLEIRDADHPFFGSVSQLEWRSYLSGVGVQRFRLVSTGRSGAAIPLSLGDGSPLLISQEIKGGRLMLWTSSVDVDWTNFPLEFGYVPFVRQACTWLAGRDLDSAFAAMTVDEAAAAGLQDTLVLKQTPDAFARLNLDGLKPGIYTRVEGGRTQFVQLGLAPEEMDFTDLEADTSQEGGASTLADLGFRGYPRTDLAPRVQWLLFALLLVETLVAGRITLSWGAR